MPRMHTYVSALNQHVTDFFVLSSKPHTHKQRTLDLPVSEGMQTYSACNYNTVVWYYELIVIMQVPFKVEK